MKEVLDAVDKDKIAGVHRREDGKLYFVQRKVEFNTIDFKPEYIFSNPWGIFQKPLNPINWSLPIGELEKELIQFSIDCSERFHYLWYYYIDIMIARSLSTNDKNIFTKNFIIPSIFLDLGIPENPLWTNVPKTIHQKIIQEYKNSLKFNTKFRIFYLSQYLHDLTKDIIEFLKPFQKLWDLEKQKLDYYNQIRNLVQSFFSKNFFYFIKTKLNQIIKESLLNNNINFSNQILENIYFYFKRENFSREFTFFERRVFLEHFIKTKTIKMSEGDKVQNLNFLILLNELTNFPHQLERIVRKILFLENLIFKEEVKEIKKLYIKYTKNKNFKLEPEKFLFFSSDKQNQQIEEKINLIGELMEFLNFNHYYYLETLIEIYEKNQTKNLKEIERNFYQIINNQHTIKEELKKNLLNLLKDIGLLNKEILKFYKESLYCDEVEFTPNPKYLDRIKKNKFMPGNPFQEKEILNFFKDVIKQRLRAIRMASNEYSLLAKEKHGILTLNPVLKLWKNQIHFQKELPEIVQLELNTPLTIECLIDLVLLVDPNLKERELLRGKIIKKIRGKENLENMKFILLPGSCYPLKEIPSSHFPEYKYRIIGEKRTYKEVGILDTHYILTGAWYNKKNHTLYYPIGGDNGELLKRIYLGIKVDIVPAFFFAIGQFVFDCLSDTILYYKNQKLTFREILLKMKKNKQNNIKEKRFILYSKNEIKFEFSILYSLLIMENLTGSLHIRNKISELYKWFFENLGIQSIFKVDKEERKEIRIRAQKIIEEYNSLWLKLSK